MPIRQLTVKSNNCPNLATRQFRRSLSYNPLHLSLHTLALRWSIPRLPCRQTSARSHRQTFLSWKLTFRLAAKAKRVNSTITRQLFSALTRLTPHGLRSERGKNQLSFNSKTRNFATMILWDSHSHTARPLHIGMQVWLFNVHFD